ncbi:amidohydrolase family protein [Mameliella alba]|nr:amidohydrolase family protein [Mameliella alba]MBY6168714.1 amidohydrolase family protein [Mameliella alba]MBY6174065.1 amidohydrolase family protein [Mameliella alba]
MTRTAIDAHVHIWNRTRGETFIAEKQFPALTGKSFLPEDLVPVLAATNAASAVLVHGPATVEHALYCLELCRTQRVFRSVIGWVDLRDPGCAAQLSRQSGDPGFRGVRFTPMLDSDPEGYLRSDGAGTVCAGLQSGGHLVEILAPQPLFGAVADLARAFPGMPVVLAHFGLPDGSTQGFDGWRQAMARLAALPNIHVKLSGLPLSANSDADTAMARAHVKAMVDLFGPQRLIYASNWPVATALASPAYWRNLLDETLEHMQMGAPQRDALFHDNAARLY